MKKKKDSITRLHYGRIELCPMDKKQKGDYKLFIKKLSTREVKI